MNDSTNDIGYLRVGSRYLYYNTSNVRRRRRSKLYFYSRDEFCIRTRKIDNVQMRIRLKNLTLSSINVI